MYLTSYETTMGSTSIIKPIIDSIKKAILTDEINKVTLDVQSDGKYQPLFITGIFNSESDIPLFSHPIVIDNFNGKNYICSDIRLYINKSNIVNGISDINNAIKNKTEFNFAKSRLILNMLWLNGGVQAIKNSTVLANTVFSVWLADSLSKHYALDMGDKISLTVIASIFYQSLFMSDNTFDEQEKQKIAIHTINATSQKSDLVFQILDQLKPMNNLYDFIENIKSVLQNVRLSELNIPVLFNLIRNSWYGTNSKDVIAVAVEHPPTWIAMVFAALTEKTFKNSNISIIANNFGKRGKSDEFLKNYTRLVTDTLAMEEISNSELVSRYE